MLTVLKQYLVLIYQMSRREIIGRYRGSAMGLLWSFASPLVMLAVYTFVFSVVFRVRWQTGGDDNASFALNLFAGVIVHGFFAECVNRSPTLIAENTGYVKKVVFPLWMIPAIVVVAAMFHMLVSLLVLLICSGLYLQQFHFSVLALPLLLAPYALLVLGVGWFFAALGVYLRDLAQVLPVVTTVMMFMAPVFYPVEALPEAFRPWMYLNPLTFVIGEMRGLVLSGAMPHWATLAKFTAIALLVALAGWKVFRKAQPGFADVL
jgi:lipopolysaccharide transport system permease protein